MYIYLYKTLRPLSIFLMIWIYLISFTTAHADPNQNPNILILGDSLSAGYGIDIDTSWPTLLQQKIQQLNKKYHIINKSISGATSSLAKDTINHYLQEYHPKIVILALGSNDGLRGIKLTTLQNNLDFTIIQSINANAIVLLCEFKLPPNYGHKHQQQFVQVFQQLAKNYPQIIYVPFILEKFATNLEYFQHDQLHPNQAAQIIILDTIWPYILKALKATK